MFFGGRPGPHVEVGVGTIVYKNMGYKHQGYTCMDAELIAERGATG